MQKYRETIEKYGLTMVPPKDSYDYKEFKRINKAGKFTNPYKELSMAMLFGAKTVIKDMDKLKSAIRIPDKYDEVFDVLNDRIGIDVYLSNDRSRGGNLVEYFLGMNVLDSENAIFSILMRNPEKGGLSKEEIKMMELFKKGSGTAKVREKAKKLDELWMELTVDLVFTNVITREVTEILREEKTENSLMNWLEEQGSKIQKT